MFLRKWMAFFLAMVSLMRLAAWVYAHDSQPTLEVFGDLIETGAKEMPVLYQIPLVDADGIMNGEVRGVLRDGRLWEVIIHQDRVVGIGEGTFLKNAWAEALERAGESLSRRFEASASIIRQELVLVHPLSFLVRVVFSTGEREITDWYYNPMSRVLTFLDLSPTPTALPGECDTLKPELTGPRYRSVAFDLPRYDYYLSDLAVAVVTLGDYWKARDWITIPLHPADPDFFQLNLNMMMQDVDTLRRRCGCDGSDDGIAGIVQSFIDARGGNITVERRSFSPGQPGDRERFVAALNQMIVDDGQPCLIEYLDKEDSARYAVLTGYVLHPGALFLECRLAFPGGTEGWRRYAFRWDEHCSTLNVFSVQLEEKG